MTNARTAAAALLAALALHGPEAPRSSAHGFVVKEPPTPIKWPVVGTLPDFLARGGVDRLMEIYEDMYAEFGSIYGTSIMGEDELVVCDPRVYDAVVRREGRFPIGGAESAVTFKEYYEETNNSMGIKSMSRGPEWKEWRGPFQVDMYKNWESFMPTIAETAAKISRVAGYEVTESKNIAFIDFITRSAFDMFSTVMYGMSPQTTDSKVADSSEIEFVEATQAAFDLTGEVLTNPFEKMFGSDKYQLFKINMDKTFAFGQQKTESLVSQVMEKQKEQVVEAEQGSKCPVTAMKNNMPFLERLVTRGQLPMEDITTSSGPLLMAGVDTTAYVMSWLYLNLASNPDAQAKLAEELKSVLDGADVTSAEQMDSLPYLKACVRESHRLTPPTPILQKKLKEDIDVVVGDAAYRVLAGQKISLNIRAYPMDPKYVDSPHLYQPERFLPEAIAARSGTPSEIIDHPSLSDPFGRGKRRCLGANIAIAEIAILTARLIQDYEIVLSDPNDANKWRPKQKLMLKADPYPSMRLVPRL